MIKTNVDTLSLSGADFTIDQDDCIDFGDWCQFESWYRVDVEAHTIVILATKSTLGADI